MSTTLTLAPEDVAFFVERIKAGGHVTITVWSGNRDGDAFRVTADLYFQREDGSTGRVGLTYHLIESGALARARRHRFHGARHMAIFGGGGTPVAADTVRILERMLGMEPYSIQNWSEA